jgi:hypothetical protein
MGIEVVRGSSLIDNSPMYLKNIIPLVLLVCLLAQTANALDVEPRRWSHLPLDTHFVGIAYHYGGENEVNGVSKDNRGENQAWGASIAYPLNRQLGVSLTYIENRTQESTGLDSESLAFGVAFSF